MTRDLGDTLTDQTCALTRAELRREGKVRVARRERELKVGRAVDLRLAARHAGAAADGATPAAPRTPRASVQRGVARAVGSCDV